ncbi:MAG: tetratricopeptide repeat protein, partial [Candidatus Eisenbacteria sp.]|nr:tetratricopeptide repeat protein [Candidatus Eisenbacteria bacterium]
AVLLFQAALGLIAAGLVAWALSPVLSPRARWMAAFLYAIHPIGVFLEMRLQPTAYAICLMLIALRLLFFSGRRRADLSGLGGLVLGLGFLLQPLAFLALAATGIWIRLRAPAADMDDGRIRRRAWGSASILTIAFLLLPVTLCIHNTALEGGGPTWNWSDAVSFHRTLEPGSWGTARPPQPPAWPGPGQAEVVANEAAGRELTPWEIAKSHRGQALRSLAERPLAFIRSALIRGSLLLSRHEIPDPVSPTFVLKRSAPAIQWGLYLFPVLLALAAIGILRLRNEQQPHPFWAPILAFALVNLIGTHSCQSRWLFVITLLPLAALGLEALPSLGRATLGRGGPRYVLPAALGLLILSALDLPGANFRCEDRSEDLRYEAALVLKARNIKGAISRLRDAIRADSGNAMAHAELANLLAREDLPEAARNEYEEALRADPLNATALYGLSEVLRSLSLYAEAESVAVRLVQHHPRHPGYLNQLGAIRMLQGSFDAAKQLFLRALEISPNYQVALINLRTAKRAEEEAPTLAFPEDMTPPPESELWKLGGEALQALQAQAWDKADSLTSVGLAKFPGDPLASYLRGAFLLRAGRPQESAELLTQVVRMAPGRMLTTNVAARALMAAGSP